MTREELLKVAKPMMVNSEVAKTMDRKTQTRRVATSSHRGNVVSPKLYETGKCYFHELNNGNNFFIKAKWKVGDILWVREPAKTIRFMTRTMDKNIALNYKYTSDGVTKWVDIPDRIKNGLSQWFLERERGVPNGCIKEMARTFLRVTNVRVELLQDIECEDISAEGFPSGEYELKKEKMYSNDTHGEVDYEEDCAFEWWINLWNRTATIGCLWEDNPYVFVYEFERVEATE